MQVTYSILTNNCGIRSSSVRWHFPLGSKSSPCSSLDFTFLYRVLYMYYLYVHVIHVMFTLQFTFCHVLRNILRISIRSATEPPCIVTFIIIRQVAIWSGSLALLKCQLGNYCVAGQFCHSQLLVQFICSLLYNHSGASFAIY